MMENHTEKRIEDEMAIGIREGLGLRGIRIK